MDSAASPLTFLQLQLGHLPTLGRPTLPQWPPVAPRNIVCIFTNPHSTTFQPKEVTQELRLFTNTSWQSSLLPQSWESKDSVRWGDSPIRTNKTDVKGIGYDCGFLQLVSDMAALQDTRSQDKVPAAIWFCGLYSTSPVEVHYIYGSL